MPRPSEGALRRQLNARKREQFPWMLEVTKCAPQEAIIQLGRAYKSWFDSLAGKRKGPKVRAPRFKRKGERDRFKIHGIVVAFEGSRIRIPNLGWVRMREGCYYAYDQFHLISMGCMDFDGQPQNNLSAAPFSHMSFSGAVAALHGAERVCPSFPLQEAE